MGLLLSIFVIYVSVIEFLDVYSNFRIRLQPAATTKDFSPLIRRYEEGLHKERRRILKILEEYRKIQELEESEPTTSKDKSIPSIVTTCNSRSPSPPLFLNHNANHNHVDYNSSELATTSYNDRGRHSPSPQPIPAAPRNSICEDFPHAEVHTKFNSLDSLDSAELQSETFDSTYFWSSKVRIDKKKSKGKEGRVKGSKKHVKFGLTVEELEPDWSRAPSPIFKVLTNSALNKSKAVNFQSLQITDLVPEDYWKRSPSPFEDFLDASPTTEGGAWDANKKTASSDEDEEKPYFGPEFLHVLDGIKLRRSSSSSVDKYSIALDSWDPSRRISSDEEGEGSASYDEKFMDALDGLTPTKIDEKKRSFRMKKGRRKHKRTVVENGTKQNGFDLSYSSYSETDTDLEESIEKRAIRVSEEANEFIDLDAATSSNERNSAENAFWVTSLS